MVNPTTVHPQCLFPKRRVFIRQRQRMASKDKELSVGKIIVTSAPDAAASSPPSAAVTIPLLKFVLSSAIAGFTYEIHTVEKSYKGTTFLRAVINSPNSLTW